MIELLAEFMGWEIACDFPKDHIDNDLCSFCTWRNKETGADVCDWDYFNPLEDANDTELVLDRLVENGLDDEYLDALYDVVNMSEEKHDYYGLGHAVFFATKQQRMQAACKIIELENKIK